MEKLNINYVEIESGKAKLNEKLLENDVLYGFFDNDEFGLNSKKGFSDIKKNIPGIVKNVSNHIVDINKKNVDNEVVEKINKTISNFIEEININNEESLSYLGNEDLNKKILKTFKGSLFGKVLEI